MSRFLLAALGAVCFLMSQSSAEDPGQGQPPQPMPYIKFDGPAGEGQTSPTSPAGGRITATGTYGTGTWQSSGIDRTCYYKLQGTGTWYAMPTTDGGAWRPEIVVCLDFGAGCGYLSGQVRVEEKCPESGVC
jgi:hypothetical protein